MLKNLYFFMTATLIITISTTNTSFASHGEGRFEEGVFEKICAQAQQVAATSLGKKQYLGECLIEFKDQNDSSSETHDLSEDESEDEVFFAEKHEAFLTKQIKHCNQESQFFSDLEPMYQVLCRLNTETVRADEFFGDEFIEQPSLSHIHPQLREVIQELRMPLLIAIANRHGTVLKKKLSFVVDPREVEAFFGGHGRISDFSIQKEVLQAKVDEIIEVLPGSDHNEKLLHFKQLVKSLKKIETRGMISVELLKIKLYKAHFSYEAHFSHEVHLASYSLIKRRYKAHEALKAKICNLERALEEEKAKLFITSKVLFPEYMKLKNSLMDGAFIHNEVERLVAERAERETEAAEEEEEDGEEG